jgi:hypothetical protein
LPFIKRAAIMLSASITLSQDLRFHGLPAFNSGTRASRCQRRTVSGRMMVMALRIDGNHRYSRMKNRRSPVENSTRPLTLTSQRDQLMSQRGILGLKSARRLERRGQKPEQEA